MDTTSCNKDGDKSSSTPPPVDPKISNAFACLGTIPNFASAKLSRPLSPGLLHLTTTVSQRDLVRGAKRKYISQYVLNDPTSPSKNANTDLVLTKFFPLELGDAGLTCVSPSGKSIAVQRNVTETAKGKKPKRRFIEIWSEGSLSKSIEVTDTHGEFFTDDTFGSLVFSNDETKLAYIAERVPSEEGMAKFDYRQDWGERFGKKQTPCLVLVDITAGTSKLLDLDVNRKDKDEKVNEPAKPLPEVIAQGLACGQVVFAPNDQGLVFIGLQQRPFQFGIVYCFNRPSRIYSINLDLDIQSIKPISSPDVCARSPVISETGDLYYLTKSLNGAHNTFGTIMRVSYSGAMDGTSIPEKVSEKLFVDGFPSTPLAHNGQCLIATATVRCQHKVMLLNLKTKKVSYVGDDTLASWDVVDTFDNFVIASRTEPNRPGQLYLGVINSNCETIDWHFIAKPPVSAETQSLLDNIAYEVVRNPEKSSDLETIFLYPRSYDAKSMITPAPAPGQPAKFPLICFPHGGPNAAYATQYFLYPPALVACGFAVALVNYTGSTGYDSVEDILGKIGDLDVTDTHHVTLHLQKHPSVDSTQTFVTGGSHGGFLTAWLLGKYPNVYKAGVLRNPVINVGCMVATTDIPDWCFAEAGINDYDVRSPRVMTPQDYETMYKKSPASVLQNVKAPVLLLLGDGDRRVPPTEGLWYFHHLTALKKQAKVLMFPDVGHALDTFDAEKNGFEALVDWFQKSL